MRAFAKLLVLASPLLVLGVGPDALAKAPPRRAARKKPAAAAPAPADDAPMEATDTAAAPDNAAPTTQASPDAKPAEAPPPPPKEAPEPAAPAPPAAKPDDAPTLVPGPSPDLAKLRADYDKLRDDLFRARSRAALVQEGLYEARLGARLRWDAAPDYQIRHAEIRLDGGTIWDSGTAPVTDDKITVADRPCKPGPHALTVRLEVRPGTKKKGKDIEGLGYVTEQTFSIVVPDRKLTTVVLEGDEDGSLPDYEPELELELETKNLEK